MAAESTSGNARHEFEICILAGGLSTRMGRDKAGLRLGAQTLLALIKAAALSTGLPVRVIHRDLTPRCGPLGGIFTALSTTRAAAVLFMACDMPFVSAALLHKLVAAHSRGRRAVFVSVRRLAGFPCLLPVATLKAAEQQIAQQRYSLQELASVIRARQIRLTATEKRQLFNINTPEDWKAALEFVHLEP